MTAQDFLLECYAAFCVNLLTSIRKHAGQQLFGADLPFEAQLMPLVLKEHWTTARGILAEMESRNEEPAEAMDLLSRFSELAFRADPKAEPNTARIGQYYIVWLKVLTRFIKETQTVPLDYPAETDEEFLAVANMEQTDAGLSGHAGGHRRPRS